MKSLIIFIFCLSAYSFLDAQKGFTNYTFTTGLSTSNAKLIGLSMEGAGNKKIHAGILAEALFYSGSASKLSINSDKTFVSAGLFVKAKLGSTRNFVYQVYMGGNIGTDNKTTIWYPYLGFEQNFFCSPHTAFVLGEKCLYVFRIPANNWQPFLSIGFRFSY